jgi:pimeloyl-ACP methyl ester carboxylesterase
MKSLFLILIFMTSCNAVNNHDLVMLKYANSRTGSKFFEHKGSKLHYRVEGQGPVILLLPGTSDTLHSYTKLVEGLSSKFTLVSIDLPGFGFSDGVDPTGDLLAQINSKIINLLNHLDFKQVNIIGNSLGGLVAWNLKLRYPRIVNKVILLDPAAYSQKLPWFFNTKSSFSELLGEFTLSYIPLNYLLTLYAGVSDEMFGPAFDKNFMKEQILRLSEIFQTDKNIRKYIATLNSFHKYEFQDANEIAQMNGEDLLLIYGENDGVIPYKEHILKWKKDLPAIKVVIRKNGGHLPHWENPRELTDFANSFL